MSEAAILQGLNDKQKQATVTTQGPLLVLAGAGSGKTRVLTHRIAYLIEEQCVLPWHILAITFTNKAAKEMQARVQKLLGEQAQGVWVSTFHAMCVRILRREAQALGFSRAFTITGSSEQLTLVKQILKQLNLDPKKYDPRALLSIISSAKNELLTPKGYAHTASGPFEEVAAQVYQRYQAELANNQSMDFDDLIMQTTVLFEQNPLILERYQDKFQYIHVDEYQDTNDAQYRLVNLLAAKNQNLCVVGDGDQSIYGWRGANMDNIMNFEKDYPQAQTILLEQNYRSTKTILQAANDVIKNNDYRKPKALWTDNAQGEQITYYRAGSEQDEALYVVDQISKLHQEDNYRLKDFAILYRTNAQSRVFEDKLLKANLAYKIIGGHKFYDRKEIRDVLAYLQLVANPQDSMSFQRIINEPKRGIGAGSLDKLRQAADEKNVNLLEAALNADSVIGLTKKVRTNLQQFAQMIQALSQDYAGQKMTDLMQAVLEQSGYVANLEHQDNLESQTRLENIQELLTVTQDFDRCYEPEDEQAEPLIDFLAELALVSSEDAEDDQDDQLTLMTLHAAKGLEFPIVFLVGMEEGIFPLSRSLTDENQLEEERRLAYVGITRAQEKLYLTSAWSRMLYGRSQSNPQSRFVDEIDSELLDQKTSTVAAQSSTSYPFDQKRSLRRIRKPQQKPVAPQVSNKSDAGDVAWQVGQQVAHKKWGVGTVVKVNGQGEAAELDIAFTEPIGVKRLLAEFAPIKKV
ncbi:DNA helicase PcrA [Bombilactobacillus folatiphilus]|uniref:ATP-dependent DNA helicase n=1 Tax=Bombilactobacillus folatiphilus TaxID=2923362 RepID=A0ABY4P804_9LACO|nr:DNA helicase PcrA [Bombilactobacillus folatiphilus]UQS81829.1 DNA helicase PcrA [Bombilactobacillus folatiphilus]